MRVGSQRDPRLAPLLAGVLALGVVACGPTQPTISPSPSTPASPSAVPSSVPTASQPAPDPSASGTADAEPSLPEGVIVDPGLLEVLPLEVDGIPLLPDPATAEEVASDPMLAESALSIAVALAVAPAASGSENLAIANVIRLRPDVIDESFEASFYPVWRADYNEAACEVAGGVESESPTEIAGRQTFVGTCAGGAMTYHVYLVDQGFIVSITATGDRQLGEQILAALAT